MLGGASHLHSPFEEKRPAINTTKKHPTQPSNPATPASPTTPVRAKATAAKATPATPIPATPIPATPIPATPIPATPIPATPIPATPAADPSAAITAAVQQAITQLNAIDTSLGSDPPLSTTDKRHAARMRKGGSSVVAIIASLATQHQVESPALQVSTMAANASKASALQPLVSRLASLSQHIDDVVFMAQGTAWEEAMQFYSLLQRRSTSDTELATALAPVKQFFARKPEPKAAGAPTKSQARANAKAVKRLKLAAPQLLASTSQGTAGSSGAAPSTTATASGSAPPATASTSSTPASPAASSTHS